MLKSLFHFIGITSPSTELDKFEPIYGLPKRSLAEWLSRNAKLKEEYESELLARSQRLAAREARSIRHKCQVMPCRYFARAGRATRLLARRTAFAAISIIAGLSHARSSR